MIEIRYGARVEWTRELVDFAAVQRLTPFHCWQNEVVEERFRSGKKPAVNVAFLRVARLTEPFVFPNASQYGGCRSWVSLPELPSGIAMEEVLPDDRHLAIQDKLKKAIGG
jgi:hypothetical protein